VKEDEKGRSFFLVGKGQVKVTRHGRLLNTLDERECFGEMAFIRGGEAPRHATVESVTDMLLVEFDSETLSKMSVSAQLHLTRALVRNLADRLQAANTRIAL
jgi:CRP-like cAMP-binding protein